MMAPVSRAAEYLYGQAYLLLTMNMLFWSGNAVMSRYVAGHVPPIGLAWIRWTLATMVLLPFAWRHLKRDWPEIRRNLPILTVISVAGITCYNTMAYIGFQYTEALNGVLVQSTAPLLIGLWSFVLYRHRLTAFQLVGILISMAGVAVIMTRGHLELLAEMRLNIGDLWILGALTCYALYAALLRRRPAIHWVSLIVVCFVLGNLALTPFFLWEISTGYTLKPDWTTTWSVAYATIFATLLAYVFFNRGVQLIGPNRAGPFFHLIPLFGAIQAVLLLGETFQLFHLAGIVAILAGIVLATRTPRPEAQGEKA